MRVKWVGNRTNEDQTGVIKLKSGKVIVREGIVGDDRAGQPVELTDEEYGEVAGRYQFEVLDQERPAAQESVSESPSTPSGFQTGGRVSSR